MKTRIASTKKRIFVLPLGNGWAVKASNSGKFIVITSSKSEAVAAGRTMAKSTHGSLIIHGKDGRVIENSSYLKKGTYPASTHSASKVNEPKNRFYGTNAMVSKKK